MHLLKSKTRTHPRPTLYEEHLRGRGGREATEGTSHPQMESAAGGVGAKLEAATGDNGWVATPPMSDISELLQQIKKVKECHDFYPSVGLLGSAFFMSA